MDRAKNIDFIKKAEKISQQYFDAMKLVPLKEKESKDPGVIMHNGLMDEFYSVWSDITDYYLEMVDLSLGLDGLTNEQLANRVRQVEKVMDKMDDNIYDCYLCLKHFKLFALASNAVPKQQERSMRLAEQRQRSAMRSVSSMITVLPKKYVQSFPGGIEYQEAEQRFYRKKKSKSAVE
jgi:hypothetical protein